MKKFRLLVNFPPNRSLPESFVWESYVRYTLALSISFVGFKHLFHILLVIGGISCTILLKTGSIGSSADPPSRI